MIFPQFENIKIINDIRAKYDPLANHVKPHITLVFTFESYITSTELKKHIEGVIMEIKPFLLTMDKIIKIDNSLGMYLFLTLNEGIKEIKHLSSNLYTGILESYKPQWLNNETFFPHMTIGSFSSIDNLNKAYIDVSNIEETLTTIVNKVSVEIIDEIEDSIIDFEIELKND